MQVCQMGFSSIPVVNMAGRIIGLIPRNFVVTLIENHVWYDEGKLTGAHRASGVVSMYYKSALTRQLSEKQSEGSPRASSMGEDQKYFFDGDDDDKHKKPLVKVENS